MGAGNATYCLTLSVLLLSVLVLGGGVTFAIFVWRDHKIKIARLERRVREIYRSVKAEGILLPSHAKNLTKRNSTRAHGKSRKALALATLGLEWRTQMASTEEVADTLQQVHKLFLKPDRDGGVVVRMWECSMPCMDLIEPPPPCESCMTAMQRCVNMELGERKRVGCILRWDLPMTIFHNGRCAVPETGNEEATRFELSYNVTASGVGWIFADLNQKSLRAGRRGMFAHDAGVWRQLGPKSKRMIECPNPKNLSLETVGAEYASERHHALNSGVGISQNNIQLADAEYVSKFIDDRSHNCYNSLWHQGFARQRAYAELLAKLRPKIEPHQRQCDWRRGALYNQVHYDGFRVRGGRMRNTSQLPFSAIFYVNDTFSASMGRANSELLSHALRVATKGLESALDAQKALFDQLGRVFPILQFKVNAECYDPSPLMARLQAAKDPTRTKSGGIRHSKWSFDFRAPTLFYPPPK